MNKKKQNRKIDNIFSNMKIDGVEGKITCLECTDAFCCKSKSKVSITEKEKMLLQKKITPTQKERANIELNRRIFNPTYFYRCPFLGEDNKCEIYNIRPLSCATYFVIDEPYLCEDPNGETRQINPLEIAMGLLSKKVIHLEDVTGDILDILDIFKV